MIKNSVKNARGFTLIEILVVIGIIAILATIVIVAINPARQFAQANDTTRSANVNAILNAIGQEMADNKGVFNSTFTANGTTYTCPALPAAAQLIYTDNTGGAGTTDLSCLVPTYIPVIPADPTAGAAPNTGYKVIVTNGRVTVSAVGQITASISVTR